MSALIAIIAIFSGSAILLVALLAYWLRQRALQEPKPRQPKPKRRKKAADGSFEPEEDAEPAPPLRQGRSRLISAATLAEAEAANSAPEIELVDPETAELDSALPPVEPKLPPLAAAARQAIVFRQHFPPHLGSESRSFFGGTPYVPGTLEWPRDPESEKALHFICQVDLAAVPAEARLDLLPDGGVLAFFLDLQWGAGDAYRVVWQQGYEGMPWAELDPPSDLSTAYGDEAAYTWPWALTPEHGIPLLPRWPFEPVRIELPEPLADDEETGSPPSWSGGGEVAEALLAAQVQDGEPELSPNPSTRKIS